MDPQDHLRTLLDGVGCTVCERVVPDDRIRLLACRDDLSFVEIECASCGSTTLGFVMANDLAPEAERLADPTPIGTDDVLDMHDLLASWQGDVASLLARRSSGSPIGRRDAPR